MQTNESWLFPRIWAGFVLLLIGVTYPLWFSSFTEQTGYPTIALWKTMPIHGRPIEWISTIMLVVSLLGATALPAKNRTLWWLIAGSLVCSFLIDQHRWQPWAYQTAIYAVVIATLPAPSARKWLIPLAASVYLYSAMGKLDYQFMHTVGQEFLSSAFRPLGGLPVHGDPSLRAQLALVFPILELGVGVGLLFSKTRKLVVPLVMLMHVVLLGILGPWGLDHSTGVLVWNLALLAQAYFLMWVEAPESSETNEPSRLNFAPIAYAVVLTAMLGPITERSGYWDHWTSWALYSPHSSRAEIEIHESAIESLPRPLRPLVEQDSDGDRWRRLNLSRWSLSVRKVPVYPQARYQLAVAHHLASQVQLNDAIRVRQRGVADRWTGQREEYRWLSQRDIEQALDPYWLNH